MVTDLTIRGAHLGLRGGSNPARLDLAPINCGSNNSGVAGCHSQREHPLLNRVDNVPRSLMATNAGIISILRFQWGVEKQSVMKFGIKPVSDGKTSLLPVTPREGFLRGRTTLQIAISGSSALHVISGPKPSEKKWDVLQDVLPVMRLTQTTAGT